jgi:hypothetical protein
MRLPLPVVQVQHLSLACCGSPDLVEGWHTERNCFSLVQLRSLSKSDRPLGSMTYPTLFCCWLIPDLSSGIKVASEGKIWLAKVGS